MKPIWAYSEPEHIFKLRAFDRYMQGHKGYIAGGCFKNLFNSETVKDIDVFFESKEDWTAAVSHFEEDDAFAFCYESKNVKAFREKTTSVVIELIQTLFGKPEDVIEKVDFSVTKFAYYKEEVTAIEFQKSGAIQRIKRDDYKAVYHPKFFEHLHLKRLIIDDQIIKPMSTFNRLLRYRSYGYIPCVETKLKLVNAIRNLPENEVLIPSNFYEGVD